MRRPTLQLPYLTFISNPSEITHANQMTPAPTVMRSRLRSATEEPPRPLDMPPPNMSESPPPRPLWSRISRISSRLVMTSTTVSERITVAQPNSRWGWQRPVSGSQGRHVVEPADAAELLVVQAGPTDQTAVDVELRHDPGNVRGLDRPAVEDPHGVGRRLPPRLRHVLPDRRTDLVGVLRRRHLAGPDRPHRLVGDHECGDLLRGQPRERPLDLFPCVLDVALVLADVKPLPDAHDRCDPRRDRLLGLGVDDLVGLRVVCAALGVPDHDVRAAELREHPRRDLAGVGAAVVA